MPQPTQNNSFEFSHLAAQVDQFDKPGNPFELAPSMEELLRRVGIVKGWIVEKKLKPEDVPTAERWLQYVEERAGVDAVTKKTIQEFRAGMTFSKMNPKERYDKIIAEFRQDADNPKKFNEFIEVFIQDRALYSKEQAIAEFHQVWKIVIVDLGYSVKIEGNAVIIYDRNGMIDRERTASMAKLPDAVAIYRKQQEFARARVEAEYKNPKDRILATINAYNRKARTKRTPVLPALTPGILANEGARNIYINDVMNSAMSEEDKAIVVDYLKSPAEAEAIYLDAQKAATTERARIFAASSKADEFAQKAGVETGITAEDWYHPERVIGKVMSGMGVWIAPAGLYLILNLFGVSHDSLLMKLLAGSTVIGVAKGTGLWKMGVDIAQGKNQTANEAVNWAKKQWDTSNENGVVKWVKDLVGDGAAAIKENITYFNSWIAYSNYNALYNEGGKSEARELMKIPFDYVYGHIQSGTFDARFNKDESTLRSKGSEYANFVSLMNALNTEGVRNYGEKRWREVRANRTIAEVVTIAYKKDAVPLGQSETPRPASSAGPAVAGVAAAASALAASSSDGATTVRDAVKTGGKLVSNVAGEAVDAAGKKLKPVADWGTGTESPADKEAREKKEAERAAEWKKGEGTRGSYTQRVLADTVMVKAWNEKKENKDKGLKVEQYLEFINSQSFQYGISLENAFDFAGPDRRSLAVSPPSNLDTRTFTQVFRKYLFNTMDPLAKGVKENFFADKKNEPYAKKSLAEFMTK
ncbi:hypothetical protein KBC86_00840 [Candidatus Gracilibacteria bacterium]|nr:hypothetical protein [Candidatus Gracilibacteria bacterium]